MGNKKELQDRTKKSEDFRVLRNAIISDIEKIKKGLDEYYWPAMELGYKCWAIGNQDRAETEKLKFKKMYFLAYENSN